MECYELFLQSEQALINKKTMFLTICRFLLAHFVSLKEADARDRRYKNSYDH